MGATSDELRHVIEGYEWFLAERCDIVHDHTLAGPFVASGSVPGIVTNHGPLDQPESATIFRRVQAMMPIIAISHQQATDAIRVGIRATHVIPHGIDIDEVTPGSGLGDAEGRYLLFLGRDRIRTRASRRRSTWHGPPGGASSSHPNARTRPAASTSSR